MTPGCAAKQSKGAFIPGCFSFLLFVFVMLKLIKTLRYQLKFQISYWHLISEKCSTKWSKIWSTCYVQMVCLVHFKSGWRRFRSIVLHSKTRVCYQVPLATSTGYGLQSDGIQVVPYHGKLTVWKIYESLTSCSTVSNTLIPNPECEHQL